MIDHDCTNDVYSNVWERRRGVSENHECFHMFSLTILETSQHFVSRIKCFHRRLIHVSRVHTQTMNRDACSRPEDASLV